MTAVTLEGYASLLEETLPGVRARIAEAALAVGRDAASITLVGVTKGHPVEAVRAALEAGLDDLGENRVGELEGKRTELGDVAARWHFIGHIQSRKAGRAVAASDVIHSIDSLKLGRRVGRASEDRGEPMPVFLQVNTSGEDAKGGFEGDQVVEALHEVAELPGLRVLGLMTMAPFVEDERVLAEAFAGLRALSERLRSVSGGVGPELSMGMTNDLEIAIREGSTMVRIGTALFGERGRA
ncbi:MAG: YggS family pyridoxal phosphate-dependent enzyme [Gemmatimonadota bacterium]